MPAGQGFEHAALPLVQWSELVQGFVEFRCRRIASARCRSATIVGTASRPANHC